MQRVGFGKGMYDRFFEKLQKRPYTVFIQPKLCHTKEKICDRYDITGDVVITPTDMIKNRALTKKRN
jgi:5-formyltetrahydrofolate cyclo-ligase